MKGLVQYAWSHTVISDQMNEHVNQVCDFKLLNWTYNCNIAMSSVFREYSKIDIYNIYAPKCNNARKISTSAEEVSHTTTKHFQVMYFLLCIFDVL